jgi:cell division protein FtsB
MQTKSQYIEKAASYVRRLSDMRFMGQAVFVVIVLLTSWSGVKTIQTNYGLQKQISGLQQQNTLQKLKNDNLALRNEYFKSSQYLELAARQNFSLAAPGEKEVIVPRNVALAYTVNLPSQDKPVAAKAKQPAYQRNFEAWVDFFLHRQNLAH